MNRKCVLNLLCVCVCVLPATFVSKLVSDENCTIFYIYTLCVCVCVCVHLVKVTATKHILLISLKVVVTKVTMKSMDIKMY